MNPLVLYLPHVNASLNTLATLLLLLGWVFIKRKQEAAHKFTMFAAFGTSVVFLVSYLIYHFYKEHTLFPASYGDTIRYAYYALLASHVLLAATVPILTITTIYFGITDQRTRHRQWAKITFPIWLYVSVTGVIVYLMLYHLFPAKLAESTINILREHQYELIAVTSTRG